MSATPSEGMRPKYLSIIFCTCCLPSVAVFVLTSNYIPPCYAMPCHAMPCHVHMDKEDRGGISIRCPLRLCLAFVAWYMVEDGRGRARGTKRNKARCIALQAAIAVRSSSHHSALHHGAEGQCCRCWSLPLAWGVSRQRCSGGYSRLQVSYGFG